MEKANLYVTEHGAVVGCSNERLVVKRAGSVLASLPAERVNQIVILGNVILTAQAVALVLDRAIPVAYLSAAGNYRGRIEPEGSRTGALRRNQSISLSNPSMCLKLASSVVSARISNSIVFCSRRSAVVPEGNLEIMRHMHRKALRAESIQKLRGYEGAVSKLHFANLSHMLDSSLGFKQRVRVKPPDPVNSMLNLSYTLLYNQVRAAINLAGLDPYQGFMHVDEPGHASLASDLIEPFRPLIGDSVVLSVINRHVLKKEDFEETREGVRLRKDSLPKFMQAFDRRMSTKVSYLRRGETISWYRCLEFQARDFAAALRNGGDFEPIVVRT